MANKVLQTVFIDVITSNYELGKFKSFYNFNLPDKSLMNEYYDLADSRHELFEQLACLEEIIMQQKALTNLDNIKFTHLRGYIYSRLPFFRRNTKTKEIRIIVGKLSGNSDDVEAIYNDREFTEKAKKKLKTHLEKIISENITKYRLTYGERNPNPYRSNDTK